MKGKAKLYIELLRPFTLIYPAIAVLSGACIAGSYSWLVFVGAFSGSLLNGASNVVNQCFDVEIDRINKPKRPIPSGRIDKKKSLAYGSSLYSVSLFLAFLVGFQFFVIALAAASFTLMYSVPPIRTKSRGFKGNLTLVPRGVLPIVAGWSISMPVFSIEPWALGAILGLFVLGANTSKDFSDIKGDSMHGARTLPVIYGPEKSARMMVPSLTLPFLIIPLFVYSGWLIANTLPLTLLSIWGIYVAFTLLKKPERLAIERNHPSWVHMYLIMLAFTLGAAIAYTF